MKLKVGGQRIFDTNLKRTDSIAAFVGHVIKLQEANSMKRDNSFGSLGILWSACTSRIHVPDFDGGH